MATRTRIQRSVRPRREASEEAEPTGGRDPEVEAAQGEAEAVLAKIEALLNA